MRHTVNDQSGLSEYPKKHEQIGTISVKSGCGRGAVVEKDSRDRTVLIVEDSDDARYFMKLGQYGY